MDALIVKASDGSNKPLPMTPPFGVGNVHTQRLARGKFHVAHDPFLIDGVALVRVGDGVDVDLVITRRRGGRVPPRGGDTPTPEGRPKVGDIHAGELLP